MGRGSGSWATAAGCGQSSIFVHRMPIVCLCFSLSSFPAIAELGSKGKDQHTLTPQVPTVLIEIHLLLGISAS